MSLVQRRVVITGMGVISPSGNSADALWEALSSGQSGVGPLEVVPSAAFPTSVAAEARKFKGKIDDFGPVEKAQKKAIRKSLKVMCRECQMGVAVAQKALADAGLKTGDSDPQRTGISFGSDYMITDAEEFSRGIQKCVNSAGQFEFPRWPTDGMSQMSPLWLLKYLPNMPASHLAIYNDFRGPNNSLTLREAVANVALGEAFQIIVGDRADVMLVGATGTRLHPIKMIHATQHEQLAQADGDPAQACRPFDQDRTGMVLGEGAGAVLIEELDRATARGATIYAEVLGGVSRASIDAHMVARREDAMANALASVLAAAGLDPEEIGHVQAHGLATQSCDIDEARAINRVFGHRKEPIPVTAAKSYFGNLGAGSGMVELIAGVLCLKEQRLFPTLNYQTPDPKCPISVVATDEVSPGNSLVNLSVTPQGQGSAALLARFAG
jgi:3-oxoacyl-[acyl-carrier-protein] synthase II